MAVPQFISNPIRCINVRNLVTLNSTAEKKGLSNNCGQEGHNEVKCANCQGNHTSNDRACPKWKEEKEIQE